jgi:hypothetical protein
MMFPYSYKMLIEPASNVSVPLTVVMRMRSRVPPKEIWPALAIVAPDAFVERQPWDTQRLDEISVKIKEPKCKLAATAVPEGSAINPVVAEANCPAPTP